MKLSGEIRHALDSEGSFCGKFIWITAPLPGCVPRQRKKQLN